MIQNISLIFIYFFELLIEYMFFSRISETKDRMPIRFFIGTLLFEGSVLVNYIFSNSILINAVYFFAVNLIFSFLCFSLPIKQRLFYVILLYGFSALPEFGTIFILSCIFKVEANAYNSDPILLIIIGCISKTLYFIICVILLQFIKKDNSHSKFPPTFYIYPCVTICSIIMFWVLTIKYTFTYKIRISLVAISIILLGATIILFLSYQQNIKKENEHLILKSEYNRLQTEKTYYDILEHQNQQLLIYAHDAKNHLNTIKDLNTDPTIDAYIKKMYDDLIDYSSVSHSGNKTLDVILNRYKTESKLKDISFSFDVRLSNLNFVDNFDLVTILDNLLDNAMEAGEKSKSRTVSLETDRRNNYEIIIISNSCDQKPVISEDRLITTKKDKVVHGLGLKSVTKTLKKYDGDIAWEYMKNKNLFVTTVVIQNSNKNITMQKSM